MPFWQEKFTLTVVAAELDAMLELIALLELITLLELIDVLLMAELATALVDALLVLLVGVTEYCKFASLNVMA